MLRQALTHFSKNTRSPALQKRSSSCTTRRRFTSHRSAFSLRRTKIRFRTSFLGGISFDYSITRRFSLGVKAEVSYDAFESDNTIYVIESLAFARWYVVSPTGEPSAGLFVEGQGGAELLLVNSDLKFAPSAGVALGFRIADGNFYFEPMLRGGYPYLFGAGIGAEFRF